MPGALDSRDVNERIGLAVIALDEAEALHRVEELDRAAGLLAGQLALRAAGAAGCTCAAAAALNRHRLAFDAKVGRRNPAAAIDQRELERLAVSEVGETGLLDCRDVHEHILAAIVTDDEAEALLRIEEFDDALAFADDLRGHSATTAAAAKAAAAAATAAAEATAAADRRRRRRRHDRRSRHRRRRRRIRRARRRSRRAPEIRRHYGGSSPKKLSRLSRPRPPRSPLRPLSKPMLVKLPSCPNYIKTNALGPRRNRS